MSHKHHNCACDHDNVKFCKTCQLVHCLDCNKEWKQNYAYTYWPYTYNQGLTSAGGAGTVGYLSTTGDNQLNNGNTLTITATKACDHKA